MGAQGWVTDWDRGVLGIMNYSPANAFAYRVMIGVTDPGQGVSGILNDRPANGVAYRMFDGVTHLDSGFGTPPSRAAL